ncbi:MAG: nitronate monooxygenase [Deltaproteobacteria bacterium]|nr:nitronate monooxygenase [Deltaproteobacteria bacterium]
MAKLNNFEMIIGSNSYRPIMIGGMGVNISTAALALGAAKLGGVGHISDAMSPFLNDMLFGTRYQANKQKETRAQEKIDPKYISRWTEDIVYRANRDYVASVMAHKKGEGGIFVNVMEKLTMGAPSETLQARLRGALDGGIDGITLSAGLHNASLRLIEDHPRFRDAHIGVIISSLRALKIFLRGASRVNRLPSYIVVEGPLAGGHLGFGEDWHRFSLNLIVEEVISYLRSEDLNIPVIPAGGVFTGTDAVNFINMGAAGVQVATRFTISQECGLPTEAKQIYLRAEEKDVEVNCSSPTGYPMRMLKSSPSLGSNLKPSCASLGYMLDREGNCSYKDLYEKTPVDAQGKKLPIYEKMCICQHFMRLQCYTCGHNVYRLKDTTIMLPDGSFYLPPMEHIFKDYLNSEDQSVELPVGNTDQSPQQASNG